MDYFTDHLTDNLSPDSGEGESHARNTYRAVIQNISEPNARLLTRIKNTFHIPDSLIGIVSITKELILDLKALSEYGFPVLQSEFLLIEFYKELLKISVIDAGSDRGQAWSLGISEVRMMIRPFHEKHSILHTKTLRAFRGIFVYFALAKSLGLSQDLQANITNLINAKHDDSAFLEKTVDQLLAYKPDNTSEIEPFINTLKKYLSTSGLCLAEIINTSVHSALPVYAELPQKIDNDFIISEEIASDERHRPTDQIGYQKYVQQFNGQRENSGIIERYEFLIPEELEEIVPSLIEDMKLEETSMQAASCILTLLLRCRPRRFSQIGLKHTDKYSAWLDIYQGCYVWDLNKLTQIKEESGAKRSHIKIPLPVQLIDFLKQLFKANPNAESLSDLFGSLEALDNECQEYLKTKSLTSHRPTLGRFEESYGKYAATKTNDETYAAAIGLDFSLGVTSNFNYTVITGVKLTAILGEIYQKLGFESYAMPEIMDVAAPNAIEATQVEKLIIQLTKNIDDAFSMLAKNVTPKNLYSFHNSFAENMLCLAAVTTGHRSADEYGYFAHTIDIFNKICLVSDKRVNDYQWGRLVPLASVVIDYLDLYLSWLESLGNRLSKIDRHLAATVNSILNSSPDNPHPLFFRIDNSKISWLGTKHIQHLFDQFKLPANCGRDYLDFVLKKHGADSTLTMMIEGHAASGQEQISLTSLVNLNSVLNEARAYLDKELDAFCNPCTVEFKPRQNKVGEYSLSTIRNKTVLAAEYKLQNPLSPQCPWNASFIRNLSQIKKQLNDWQKVDAPLDVTDLHLSLVLIDGVSSETELRAVVKALLSDGCVHVLEGNFFIDTVTPELGYRRLWISYSTVLLVINLNGASDHSRIEKNTLALIEAVQAHYVLNAPAMIGLWANGKFSSRCSRPETLARHYFKLPEISVIGEPALRKSIVFDDRLITTALSRACESNEYKGKNPTRVKQLAKDINQILKSEIDDVSVLILARFVLHLTKKDLAPSTIQRYYIAIKPFIHVFVSDIDSMAQLASFDWTVIIAYWAKSEKINSDDHSPEITAVNHFLDFAEAQTQVQRGQRRLSCPVMEPADYPSYDEITKAYAIIKKDSSLNEAFRLETLVFLGLISQRALRPSEVKAIRLIDVHFGLSSYIVITSEAIGSVKTSNANRILIIVDDDFDTLSLLKRLHNIKSKSRSPKSFLFADDDGENTVRVNVILQTIRNAIEDVTGCSTSLMSFRQHNITRDNITALNKSGLKAIVDRKALPTISALSGHGHPLTSHENYACEYDQFRKNLWELHKNSLDIQAPIFKIKERIGYTFKGNLPTNKPTYDFLMKLCKENPDFHARIKDCQEYVQPLKGALTHDTEKPSDSFVYVCRYLFYICNGVSEVDALMASRVDSTAQQMIDKGRDICARSFFKEFSAESLRGFDDILLHREFKTRTELLKSLPIYQPQAMMLIQLLPKDLTETISVTNIAQLTFFEEQQQLFALYGVEIFISINKNAQVEYRKSLRRTHFKQLTEQSLSKYIFCELSFWLKGWPLSKRSRNLSQVQQQINLILLTKSLTILGSKHEF